MKLCLLFSLTLSLSVLSAYNEANPNRIDYIEASLDDVQKQLADLQTEVQEKRVYPPAGPQINGGCNVFVVGDFIYWKANENGLGFAVKRKISSSSATVHGNGDIADPGFGPDSGFRVGLGWNTDHDDWDLYLSWTRLHTKGSAHRHAGTSHYLYSVFGNTPFSTNPIEKASAHLRIHFNVVNLEIGREFYVGEQLSLRPHFGFENAWISQHYTTKYRGHVAFQNFLAHPDDFNNIFFRNHFWGIGARAGVDTQWELGWGFSLTGDVALALLYGTFNLKRTSAVSDFLSGDLSKSHVDQHFTQARAALEFLLGMRWDLMFAGDRFHFSLTAGWEQLIYFGQNQIFNFMGTADQGKLVFYNDDLTLQGLTLSSRFDF